MLMMMPMMVDLKLTVEGGAGKFSTAEPWPPGNLSTLAACTLCQGNTIDMILGDTICFY